MTISKFERLSGDIVQRDMSLVWWAGTTNDYEPFIVFTILYYY